MKEDLVETIQVPFWMALLSRFAFRIGLEPRQIVPSGLDMCTEESSFTLSKLI